MIIATWTLCLASLLDPTATSESSPSWALVQVSRARVIRPALVDHEETNRASPQLVYPHKAESNILRRPGYGALPDTVKFGIFCKALVSTDMRTSSIVFDVVLTTVWSDNRAASVVPQNHTNITLPIEVAKQRIWLPDVVITNQGVDGIHVVSSAIFVSVTGKIQKTERLLATVIHRFDVNTFPFDTQNLTVWVASACLMTDELKLIPIEDMHMGGASLDAFQTSGFTLLSQEAEVIETIDGSLRKSRGFHVLRVARKNAGYINMVVVPEILMLVLSTSSLLFHLEPQFSMPRLAVSMLGLVAFMNITIRSNQFLPLRQSIAWIDVFDQTCESLLLLVLLCHVMQECMVRVDSYKDYAMVLNSQAPIVCPFLMITMLAILICCAGYVPVADLATATRCMMILAVFIYSCLLVVFANRRKAS